MVEIAVKNTGAVPNPAIFFCITLAIEIGFFPYNRELYEKNMVQMRHFRIFDNKVWKNIISLHLLEFEDVKATYS